MRRPLPATVVLCLLIATSAAAVEVVVFKKDSAYKGTALRVASYEKRGDRLLLHTPDGGLFTVPGDSVDWEQSRLATAASQHKSDVDAELRAEEERARQAAARSEARSQLTLVEASRRYGVDKPAMSVASGSAARESAAPPPAAPATAAGEAGTSGTAASGGSGAGAANPALKARVDALQAERDQVAKEIDQLRADNNPDPLWASQRTSRIEAKQQDLAGIDRRLQAAKAELTRASAPPRPATTPRPTPAPTPIPAPTPTQ